MSTKTETRDAEKVRETVREGYARIATAGSSCCGPEGTTLERASASCCGDVVPDDFAQAVGYDEAELALLPEGANMGLSCGNPTAVASLRPGEVVLDLGSGGGFDVFIAAGKVGPEGRAIGVDMTPEMLSKARANQSSWRERGGPDNVEFRLGEIEHLPVADASVDVAISNCVINLSPAKKQVWREIARVLRPGGRVAVSDLALLRPLPGEIREMVEALVGCVAGAVPVEDTERMAREAGLVEIELEKRSDYVASMDGWEDPLYRKISEKLPEDTRPADYITSLNLSARKA